jgi:hypothetical protein
MCRSGYSQASPANVRSRRPSIELCDKARIDLRIPDAERVNEDGISMASSCAVRLHSGVHHRIPRHDPMTADILTVLPADTSISKPHPMTHAMLIFLGLRIARPIDRPC